MYGALVRANQLIIVSYKICFFFVGIFGNACFIFLVASKRQLQSKSSILQATQCFSHIFCLIGTQVDTILTILDVQLPRSQCYPLVSGYVFFETAQAMIMLMLVIDILVIVKLPKFYHKFSTAKYVFVMLIPAVIYGTAFFLWGFTDLDDEIIIFCNPPLALHLEAGKWFARTIVLLNILTLAVFISLIRIFYIKGLTQRGDSAKVMRRLQLSVVIFLCSWFISQSAASFFFWLGLKGETLNFMVANVSFFVLLSFSQSFYVIIWKSKEYRQQFVSLWPSSHRHSLLDVLECNHKHNSQFFYVVVWRSPEYRNAFLEAWSCIACCSRHKDKFAKSSKVSVAVHSIQGLAMICSNA
ncbi:unnamed protein product [Caenorhabditis sp. 36 PRJEB53466]|nr:unnamed protein product [Caenorhabditis sp. 36 PRJEB53466]